MGRSTCSIHREFPEGIPTVMVAQPYSKSYQYLLNAEPKQKLKCCHKGCPIEGTLELGEQMYCSPHLMLQFKRKTDG